MNAFAVQLTGPAMGAIAVIALFGDDAHALFGRFATSKTLEPLVIGKFSRATLRDPATDTPIDDALIIHTANNTYELHVHGGTVVVQTLLRALQQIGAQHISLREATQRGHFGNLLHAELLTTLSTATTLTAARLLAAQTTEGLTAWSRHWQRWLAGKSPKDLWQLHSAAQWLLDRSRTLRHLLTPPRIAIVGPPNAGKSTLANALLGRPVAITSNTPGTTRDWIDAPAIFTHGPTAIPVTLIDTAGIRPTIDPLEQTSITRTHEQAAQADIILLLFDASHPLSAEQLSLARNLPPARTLLLANKLDAGQVGLQDLQHLNTPLLKISAKHSQGLDSLMTAVIIQLNLAAIDPAEPFAFTSRHIQLLEELAMTDTPATPALLLHALTPDATSPSA
jgi:tRNA modification GTPase